MNTEDDSCQAATLESGSRAVGWLAFNLQRVPWYLRKYGLAVTCNKIWRAITNHTSLRSSELAARCSHPHATTARRARPAALNLQPGELVEVRSEAEILQTLDARGRSLGLYFMPDMKAFCGKRLRVFKVVNQIALENETGVRKIRDTVLLENAFCDGGNLRCDRSCFYYWREWWLRRVEPDPAASDSETNGGSAGEHV